MKNFAIQDVTPGKLNAMVKNIMFQMDINNPQEAVRRINSGDWLVQVNKNSFYQRDKNGVIHIELPKTQNRALDWFVDRGKTSTFGDLMLHAEAEKFAGKLSDKDTKVLMDQEIFISSADVEYRMVIIPLSKLLEIADVAHFMRLFRAAETCIDERISSKPIGEAAFWTQKIISFEQMKTWGFRSISYIQPPPYKHGGNKLKTQHLSGNDIFHSIHFFYEESELNIHVDSQRVGEICTTDDSQQIGIAMML